MSSIRNFFITFMLALVVFGLIAYGILQFASTAFELGENNDGPAQDLPDEETTGGGDNGEKPVKPDEWLEIKGESFTMLLVGSDYQPNVFDDYDVSDYNETNEGFPIEPRTVKTDTIILVRFNKETGECIYSAIPTDTKITVDGLPCHLRDLYALKGIKALCDKVTSLTGFAIDFYTVATYDSFKTFMDSELVGGITYYVATNMHHADEENAYEVNLRKGSQKLNGEKALAMLRYNEYKDRYVSKRACAVSFFQELFKKLLVQGNYANSVVNYDQVFALVETNFTGEDLSSRLDLIFSYPKMQIKTYVYPGTTVGTGEEAYFSPNTTKAIEYFSQFKFKG